MFVATQASKLVESRDDQTLGSGIGLAAGTGRSGGAEMGTGQDPGGLDHDNSALVAAILRGPVAGGVGGDRIGAGIRIAGHQSDPFDGEPAPTVDLADGTAEVSCLEQPCLHASRPGDDPGRSRALVPREADRGGVGMAVGSYECEYGQVSFAHEVLEGRPGIWKWERCHTRRLSRSGAPGPGQPIRWGR